MKSFENTFSAVSISIRRNTPKTLVERLQLDWSNDVITLSPARTLQIIVFGSALSRLSKQMGILIDERTWADDDPLEVQTIG